MSFASQLVTTRNQQQSRSVLVVEDTKDKRIINLDKNIYSLGRDSKNSIVINSPLASRHHATLLQVTNPENQTSVFQIIDGNLQGNYSTNGLFINGRRCFSQSLRHKDLIVFGGQAQACYLVVDSDLSEAEILEYCETDHLFSRGTGTLDPFATIVPDDSQAKALSEATLIRLASFPELLPIPIIEIDLMGDITYLNPSALERFPDIQEKSAHHPILGGLLDAVQQEKKTFFVREISIGNHIFEQSVHYIAESHLIRSYLFDITERKRFERALYREKELAHVTLQSIADAVISTDAFGRITSLNPVAEKLTGWTSAEAEGVALKKVFRIINEVTQEPIENPVDKLLRGHHDEVLANNTVLIARNNSPVAIAHSAAPIRSREGEILGVVLVFRDVTNSRQIARQLSWQASHDPLTGLVNRWGFSQCLEQAVMSAQKQNQQHALCYLDLDKFKVVNDSCGHAAGDELLLMVSRLLVEQVRQSDIVARLGGDEFAVLLYHCPLDQGKLIAEAICQKVRELEFIYQEKIFKIGVSIGLVSIHKDTPTFNNILSVADAACYAAKHAGRNRVEVVKSEGKLDRSSGELGNDCE